eukprot:41219_1
MMVFHWVFHFLFIFCYSAKFTELPSNVMQNILNHLPMNQQLFNLSTLNQHIYRTCFTAKYQHEISRINQLTSIVSTAPSHMTRSQLQLIHNITQQIKLNPLYNIKLPQILLDINKINQHHHPLAMDIISAMNIRSISLIRGIDLSSGLSSLVLVSKLIAGHFITSYPSLPRKIRCHSQRSGCPQSLLQPKSAVICSYLYEHIFDHYYDNPSNATLLLPQLDFLSCYEWNHVKTKNVLNLMDEHGFIPWQRMTLSKIRANIFETDKHYTINEFLVWMRDASLRIQWPRNELNDFTKTVFHTHVLLELVYKYQVPYGIRMYGAKLREIFEFVLKLSLGNYKLKRRKEFDAITKILASDHFFVSDGLGYIINKYDKTETEFVQVVVHRLWNIRKDWIVEHDSQNKAKLIIIRSIIKQSKDCWFAKGNRDEAKKEIVKLINPKLRGARINTLSVMLRVVVSDNHTLNDSLNAFMNSMVSELCQHNVYWDFNTVIKENKNMNANISNVLEHIKEQQERRMKGMNVTRTMHADQIGLRLLQIPKKGNASKAMNVNSDQLGLHMLQIPNRGPWTC